MSAGLICVVILDASDEDVHEYELKDLVKSQIEKVPRSPKL